MEFKIGQKVELISADSMAAPKGTIATVCNVGEQYLYVKWGKGANGQMDGMYGFEQFKPSLRRNEQMLFNFMDI